jgi:SAM-dependent methyltransferase
MKEPEGYDLPFVAEFYDHHAKRTDDVTFYLDVASRLGGPILELGCGTGRALIPIATEGYRITGLDLSQNMLDVCRRKLEWHPCGVQVRVTLVRADMADFDLPERFRLIIIPWGPFHYLTTSEQQVRCLEGAYRHLEPGGQLILDIDTQALCKLGSKTDWPHHVSETPFQMPDGRSVIWEFKCTDVDLVKQLFSAELIYHVVCPDGKRETLIQRYPWRYFLRGEVEQMMSGCGFLIHVLHSDFNEGPSPAKNAGQLIIVAKKPTT